MTVLCVSLLASLPAAASHVVTGNGFGFAVVSPENGTVGKFYAHPYSFARPDPKSPLSEGIETANFLKEIGWSGEPAQGASADYEEDSQVIHVRRSDGEGLVLMPFGLRRPVLIVSWDPASASALWGISTSNGTGPSRAKGRANVRRRNATAQIRRHRRIPASHPAQPESPRAGRPAAALATSNAWALVSLESDSEVEPAASEFNRWRAGLAPRALAKREIAELEQWRVKPAVLFSSEEERHLWRQSEVMLRMAQSREPNRPDRNGNVRNGNGLIVACLPDGV